MRKTLLLITLLSFIFAFQACDKDDDLCLIGSGIANDYPLDLAPFNEVSLLGPINLNIKQGAVQEVVVMAQSEIFGHMSYKVKDEQLEIGFEENIRCFETDLGVWVNITVPDLNAVLASGVSEIRSNGDLDLDQLDIFVAGTGNISLSGTVGFQRVNGAGVIEMNNFELVTQTTSIVISGSGYLEVNCQDVLDINVSGAATIRYKGSPQINQSVSGVLDLQNAN